MYPLLATRTAAPDYAYPAPWRLDRSLPPPWYRLTNRGFEPAEALTVTLPGLQVAAAAKPLPPVSEAEVRLVCWMAVRGTAT